MKRIHLVLPNIFLTGWSALSKQTVRYVIVLDKWGGIPCVRCNSKRCMSCQPLCLPCYSPQEKLETPSSVLILRTQS